MTFSRTLALALFASSALAAPLPAATTAPETQAAATAAKFSTDINTFAAMYVNTVTGQKLADATLHITKLLGNERIQALDNIGDDACIAQFDQGQVCSEAAAIGAALIYAQEKQISMTSLGQQLGQSRIDALNSILTTACVAGDSNANTCSVLLSNTDLLANAALDVPDPAGHSNPYTLSQAGILILIDNAMALVTGEGSNPGPTKRA